MTDVLLTGIGGQGVLSTSVVLARAAQEQGLFVRGVTLHGLAQRGGSIPTFIRMSKGKIHSPGIMQSDADLIIAFEPLEALRAVKYARKEKTVFLVNDYPIVPIYSNVLKIPYLGREEIMKRLKPFAKEVITFNAFGKARQDYGNIIFGNLMMIGIAVGKGLIDVKQKHIENAIKNTIRHDIDKNIKAFREGVGIGKEL